MAKDNEKRLARELYINQNKNEEEVALQCKVSSRTVHRWIKEGNWKSIRDSIANAPKQRIERSQLVIDSMVEERISILKELQELQRHKDDVLSDEEQNARNVYIAILRKQAASIDDSVSKWNKRVENIDKDGKITLTVYMEVMERIFEALRYQNEALYMKTLDFQETHLEEVAAKIV